MNFRDGRRWSLANRGLTGLLKMSVLALVLAFHAHAAFAGTKPKLTSSGVANPASMVWVGNSFFYYNNSMHGHFFRLLKAADPSHKFRHSSVTISGSGFGWQDFETLFRPNAIGSYSFDDNNNVVFNKIDRLFDLALMMDCSACPIHPQLSATFTKYAQINSEIIRKHGARPVFFMSWAYADKPEMTDQLAEAYVKAANDNDAFVIPAGLAFARSLAARPDIKLHIADQRHPTLAGTYLAAATIYAALFKKSPVGLKYNAGLSAEVATHLQTMAQETVAAFYP